jgi:FtsP/CotA-like multicopper oxidase with cupredoxin domain
MRQSNIRFSVIFLAAVLVLAYSAPSFGEPVPGGTQDPTKIAKFVTPLHIPPAMPSASMNYYEIAIQQFQQQILPAVPGAVFPKTTIWSYGAINDPASLHYPANTIEAMVDVPVRVKWINGLVDSNGNYLPHLLPVDQTLHWANPPQDCIDGMPRTDCRGTSQAPYTGPVPIITHLHGAHVQPNSDGFPEAWYLPAAKNIPAGYATEGSNYDDIFGGSGAGQGFAVFEYPNTQRATTLWFHDHSLGMTRTNVYAGPAGFYLLRGGVGDVVDDVTTKKTKGDGVLPSGAYEVPLVIQDKSFNANGSLFYPGNRAFFEGLTPEKLRIPFIPDFTLAGEQSDVSPIWNPEFFGNTMVVNGNTWPFLNVEPRQYRFRILNASDSRFLILTTGWPMAPILTFHQIGADGGFLPKPEARTELLIGPAERIDMIVDFSGFAGQTITLLNIGPDEPFGGGTPEVDFPVSDPGTTGQVMQFRVSANAVDDNTTPVAKLGLPAPVSLGGASVTRKLSLNEDESQTVFVPVDDNGDYILSPDGMLQEVYPDDPFAAPFGPTSARLGILDKAGNPVPKFWMDDITESPKLGATEVWEIFNFTADAHPIHIHLVQFQILNRQALVTDEEGMAEPPARLVRGTVRGPDPGESGRKDTVIVYPGEVARVKAYFDIPGLFVWHCHILSHEDNEMMRPYCIGGGCMP